MTATTANFASAFSSSIRPFTLNRRFMPVTGFSRAKSGTNASVLNAQPPSAVVPKTAAPIVATATGASNSRPFANASMSACGNTLASNNAARGTFRPSSNKRARFAE